MPLRPTPPLDKLKPQWFQILLALADGRKHGQGIMAEVLDQTNGSMRLWPTSLYGMLRKLYDLGLIEESPFSPAESQGDRRRFYVLTAEGLATLRDEVKRKQRTIEIAIDKRVLEN